MQHTGGTVTIEHVKKCGRSHYRAYGLHYACTLSPPASGECLPQQAKCSSARRPESTRATCEIDSSCPVSDNWKRINAVVRDALASLSLSEMAVPVDCSLAHLRRPGVGDRLILHALRTTG